MAIQHTNSQERSGIFLLHAMANLPIRDEAALNIAKLPELLKRS
jgi:hypothetical protein